MNPSTHVFFAASPLILALSLAFAPEIRADIIPEGRHGVNHEIFFTGMDQFPQWDFGLFPVTFENYWRVLKEGEEPRWYHFVHPRVFAWPRSGGPPENAKFFENPALPRTDETFDRIGVVKEDDPLFRITTTYRITGIEGTRVAIRLESEGLFDRDGRPLAPVQTLAPVREARSLSLAARPTSWGRAAGLGLLAVISLALLVRLIRRLRRSPASASMSGPLP